MECEVCALSMENRSNCAKGSNLQNEMKNNFYSFQTVTISQIEINNGKKADTNLHHTTESNEVQSNNNNGKNEELYCSENKIKDNF